MPNALYRYNLHSCSVDVFRPLREEEVVLEGLLGHTNAPCLEVVDFGPPKGRGVVAKQPIQKGQYVCEYRTYRVYPVESDEAKSLAKEYDLNHEGSYILETAWPVPGVGHRLAFDATRRFKDIGRLVNHRASGYNLKPCKPTYVRKKWRVGMVAVRHIPVNEELTYDYGTRTESWMRVRRSGAEGWENGAVGRGENSREKGAEGGENWVVGEESGSENAGAEKDTSEPLMLVCEEGGENVAEGRENVSECEWRSGSEDSTSIQSQKPLWEKGAEGDNCAGGGENRSENDKVEEDMVCDMQVLDVEDKILPTPRAKRNYFWCPMPDCTSGPVQKITQHLQKKHKLPAAKASMLAKKKRRAPVEAIRLKAPNPHTRSSRMKNLSLTFSAGSDTVQSTDNSRPSPGPRLDEPPGLKTPSTSRKPPRTSPTTTPTSSKPAHPVPICTPSTSCITGDFHHDGEFLKAFHSHLRTRAGGLRGEQATKQICRYVGKYLHFLNPSKVEESTLLDPTPVQGYLSAVQVSGIGSSGALYRILAHKAAVNFMRLTVRTFAFVSRVCVCMRVCVGLSVCVCV